METFDTTRLHFRPFVASDAAALVALDSDPEVMRYLTGGKPTPRDVIVRERLPEFMKSRGRLAHWIWAAEAKPHHEFVGWFSLRPRVPGPPDEAELGYRLRRAVWGRGLATEGARALIARGFDALGLRRIFAETMAVNTASRRVLEKAGLHYVRTFHLAWNDPIPGTEHGEVEYEIRWPGSPPVAPTSVA